MTQMGRPLPLFLSQKRRTHPSVNGPIVITQGGTYTGYWASTSNSTPTVTISTTSPVTITNSTIEGKAAALITQGVSGVQLTVTNTRFYGKYPGGTGLWAGRAVDIDTIDNLTFEHNYLEQTSGIYLVNKTGSGTVKIRYNSARNIDGRFTNGSGGYSQVETDRELVQFTQFNNVTGIVNCEIAWNQIVNDPNNSGVEDNINIFQSSGTVGSPIDIHDNYIRGAYPPVATGPDYGGGGILLGDGGGSYQNSHDNIVVSTTNYGVSVAGGQNCNQYNNRVVSSGRLADNSVLQAQNIGVYVIDFSGGQPFGPDDCHDNTVGWWRAQSSDRNDAFMPDCTGTCSNGSLHAGEITLADEAAELTTWNTRVSGAGVTIGPQ